MQVVIQEEELQQERLLLAIFDDTESKLLARLSLPLQDVVPGVHYNLKLVAPEGECQHAGADADATSRSSQHHLAPPQLAPPDSWATLRMAANPAPHIPAPLPSTGLQA